MAKRMGKPSLRRSTAVLGVLAGLLLAGCAPADPLDTRVEAGDSLALAMWQSKMAGRLTPEQVITLNKALQEIRFHLMASDHQPGRGAVEAALLAKIDGETLRVVVREGLSWELERAQAEWAVMDDSVTKNSAAAARAQGPVSVDYQQVHQQQLAHLQAAADEVALTKARLAATGQLAGP